MDTMRRLMEIMRRLKEAIMGSMRRRFEEKRYMPLLLGAAGVFLLFLFTGLGFLAWSLAKGEDSPSAVVNSGTPTLTPTLAPTLTASPRPTPRSTPEFPTATPKSGEIVKIIVPPGVTPVLVYEPTPTATSVPTPRPTSTPRTVYLGTPTPTKTPRPTATPAESTPTPTLTPRPTSTPTPTLTPNPGPQNTIMTVQVVVSRCNKQGIEGARVVIWDETKTRRIGEDITDESGVGAIAVTRAMRFAAEVFAQGYSSPVYPAQRLPDKENPFVQFALTRC